MKTQKELEDKVAERQLDYDTACAEFEKDKSFDNSYTAAIFCEALAAAKHNLNQFVKSALFCLLLCAAGCTESPHNAVVTDDKNCNLAWPIRYNEGHIFHEGVTVNNDYESRVCVDGLSYTSYPHSTEEVSKPRGLILGKNGKPIPCQCK